MSEEFEIQQFVGPSSIGMSRGLGIQDGDLLHPLSQSSQNPIELSPHNHSYNPVELSPNNPIHNQPKRIQGASQGRPSVLYEELSTQTKPEFLRLIIGKRLQNNFINNLWNKSYLRKLHQLTQYQKVTLDDLRFNNNNQEANSADVFTPYSRVIFLWDISQIILYLFIFFWLPFKLSFRLQSISQLWGDNSSHYFEMVIIMILCFDVLVGMNLAFIHKGQIINNRRRILMNYLKKYAFVDLFFIHEEDQSTAAFQLIFGIVFYVLRLNKIDKILASIHEFFNLNGQLNDLVALVQVITIIIYIIHICACVWIGIGQLDYPNNWIDYYGFTDSAIYSRYNVAIYWATMTMTTVGYGDITAKNDIETAVNNVTMLIGSIVFAYSVNSIGIFVSNMYKNSQEYNRSVTLLNSFMSRNKIQFNLQTRIRSYLQYIWTEEQQMNEEEVGSIVTKLSSHLQDELNLQLKGNILKKCKIITKTFSPKLQKHLLVAMEEQSFSPEERIISINQIDDCALYIVTKGEIEIIFEGINPNGDIVKRNSLQWLKQGDYFGEMSFFTEQQRTASAIARGFVRVFKIKRECLIKLLQQYPSDLERYCQLRDQLIMKESVPMAVQCYSCSSNSHLINECNFLHFCADKEKVLKKAMFPFLQDRKSFSRKDHVRKLHPWLTSTQLSTKARACTILNIPQVIEENPDEEVIEEEEDEWDSQSSISNEQISPKNRDNSQSVTVQNVNDAEDDDKKIQKYMKNLVTPYSAFKTAGFVGDKQSEQKQSEIQSPEPKKGNSSHKISSGERPNTKKPTLIKELQIDDRTASELQPLCN